MPRFHFVAAALLAVSWSNFAWAQEAANKPRPRLELARALKSLEHAKDLLQQAKDLAQAALQDADAASAHGKELELEAVVRLAADLRQEVEALSLLVDQRVVRLRDLCARAAEEAPASLLPENDTLRMRILEAAVLPDRKAAEAALIALEKEVVGEKAASDVAGDPRVGLLRYKLAEVFRLAAAAMQGSARADPRKAEPVMLRAVAKYKSVLGSIDSADEQEGSSLHAAALRRIVQVESSLYDYYRKLAQAQPNSHSHDDKAKSHRIEAEDAFERLKRVHPEARTPNGPTFVDLARQDAEQLTR
jgi:uncharacterized protein YicC (UPF0701 family)